MSKKDKVKEKIIGLRFWLGVAVATLLAIAGWALTNYSKVEFWLIALSSIATVFLAFIIVIISRKINTRVDELEDL